MQDQKITTYLLLAVPTDVMDEADICEGSLLQFPASDGKIIIEPVMEITDFVCDGDCEDCPMRELDCIGDCEDCPCRNYCEESEAFKE